MLFRGKRYDFWHGKDGVGFRLAAHSSDLTGASAKQTFTIDWVLADGTRVLRETRSLTAVRDATATLTIVVESAFLADEQVELDGDPHHAGCHVRLAQEVADHEKQTELVVPPAAKRVKADDESIQSACPWSALVCTVAGALRIVAHFEAPDAPAESLCSARRYGRIGTFSRAKLIAGKPLSRRWRILFATAAARPDLATREGLALVAAQVW